MQRERVSRWMAEERRPVDRIVPGPVGVFDRPQPPLPARADRRSDGGQRGRRTLRVRDVMLTQVPTVGPDASIRSVAILFCEYGTDAVVVLDEWGKPAGVVSESVLAAALDAITKEDDRRPQVPPPRAGRLARKWSLEPHTPSNRPAAQPVRQDGERGVPSE